LTYSSIRVFFATMAVAVLSVPTLAQDAAPDAAADAAPARERDRAADARPAADLNIPLRMRVMVTRVDIEGATARDAFEWWSNTTGIPVLIDWAAMRRDGLDPDQTIELRLRAVRAGTLLGILMRQTQNEQATLIYETTPWFIEIMTRQQAARRPVTRVYDIRDLLIEIPQYTDAPSMDLRDALSNTNSGGGSGGIGGGVNGGALFQPLDGGGAAEAPRTRAERADELMDTIRESIEPEIWAANGGEGGSMRYFDGRLIVKAPLYVHRQIDLRQSRAGQVRGLVDDLVLGGEATPLHRNDRERLQARAGRTTTTTAEAADTRGAARSTARATRTLAETGQGVLERTSAIAAPPAAGGASGGE